MEFLTPFQEKQMSFQPDMILEYAHYLGDTFKKRGFNDVSVYADSYVTLNGRPVKDLSILMLIYINKKMI